MEMQAKLERVHKERDVGSTFVMALESDGAQLSNKIKEKEGKLTNLSEQLKKEQEHYRRA